MRKHKTYPASVKALEEDGTFRALVSVFGNIDLAGDRVMPGAFADSLQAWKAAGDPVPVIFSHRWDDLDAHIGYANPDDITETDDGLEVVGHLDIADSESARRVHQLMGRRTLREFSFAYDVQQEKRQNGANELHQLDLIEIGPTLKGMNPATQLLDIKRAPQGDTRMRTAEYRGKAVVALGGSIEQRLGMLHEAVRGWASSLLDGEGQELYAAGVEATYDQYVIAYVESWADPADGGRYYDIPYDLAGGEVTLGDPTEVAIEGVVVPKSAPQGGAKKSVHEAKHTAKPEDRDSGKGEEPGARSLKPATLIERAVIDAALFDLEPV